MHLFSIPTARLTGSHRSNFQETSSPDLFLEGLVEISDVFSITSWERAAFTLGRAGPGVSSSIPLIQAGSEAVLLENHQRL